VPGRTRAGILRPERQRFSPSGDLEGVRPPDSALLEKLARHQFEPGVEAGDDARIRPIFVGRRVEVEDFLHSLPGAPRLNFVQQFLDLVFFLQGRQPVIEIVVDHPGLGLADRLRVTHLVLYPVERRDL
jgi:hypothetical protein